MAKGENSHRAVKLEFILEGNISQTDRGEAERIRLNKRMGEQSDKQADTEWGVLKCRGCVESHQHYLAQMPPARRCWKWNYLQTKKTRQDFFFALHELPEYKSNDRRTGREGERESERESLGLALSRESVDDSSTRHFLCIAWIEGEPKSRKVLVPGPHSRTRLSCPRCPELSEISRVENIPPSEWLSRYSRPCFWQGSRDSSCPFCPSAFEF